MTHHTVSTKSYVYQVQYSVMGVFFDVLIYSCAEELHSRCAWEKIRVIAGSLTSIYVFSTIFFKNTWLSFLLPLFCLFI